MIHKIKKAWSSPTRLQLIKFVLVGISNTLIGTGCIYFLYNLIHLGYWLSSTVGYAIGSVWSYFMNKNFTFKNTEKGIRPVIRFVINIAICYVVAFSIAQPLTGFILNKMFYNMSVKIIDNIAILVGSGLFVLMNFVGQKFFAFREKG